MKKIILAIVLVVIIILYSLTGIWFDSMTAEVATKQVLSGDSHVESLMVMKTLENVQKYLAIGGFIFFAWLIVTFFQKQPNK
jgi:hypothetical protein